MRSPDPRGEKLHRRGLSSMSRLWSDYTQKREGVGNQKTTFEVKGRLYTTGKVIQRLFIIDLYT